MKLGDTRDYLATIRHDLAIGRLDHARKRLGELVNWPGDLSRASPAQMREALLDIERQLADSGG